MSEKRKTFYQSYFYQGSGNFYIHRHTENIGRVCNWRNGDYEAEPQDNLIGIYNKAKETAAKASRNYYTALLSESMDASGQALLNLSLDEERFKFIENFHKQLGEALIEQLDTDRMQRLMEHYLDTSSHTLNSKGEKEDALFDAILAAKNSPTKQALENFNKILDKISTIMNQILADTNYNLRLGVSLSRGRTKAKRSQLGSQLLNQIREFERNFDGNKVTNLQKQQVELICAKINSLAKNLQKADMTDDGLRKNMQQIFNTGFAQACAAKATDMAVQNAIQAMSQGCLSGSDNVQVQITDEAGVPTGELKYKPGQGKADIQFPHIKFTFTETGTQTSTTIDIAVGISNKFYMNCIFPNLTSRTSNDQTYHLGGSGVSLGDVLEMLFQSSLRNKYLSYNTVVHSSNIGNVWAVLQRAILIRTIVYFASTRSGSKDFAQFLFANNQLVSMWDIIKDAIEKESSAVTMSISGIGAIRGAKKDTNSMDARVEIANQKINDSHMEATISLKGLSKFAVAKSV